MFSGGIERNQGQEMDLNSHLLMILSFPCLFEKAPETEFFGEILIRFQKNLKLLTEDLKVH